MWHPYSTVDHTSALGRVVRRRASGSSVASGARTAQTGTEIEDLAHHRHLVMGGIDEATPVATLHSSNRPTGGRCSLRSVVPIGPTPAYPMLISEAFERSLRK